MKSFILILVILLLDSSAKQSLRYLRPCRNFKFSPLAVVDPYKGFAYELCLLSFPVASIARILQVAPPKGAFAEYGM